MNWVNWADAAWTCIWWDPAVVDSPSVHEDKLVGQDPTTYYGSYWGWTWANAHGNDYWYKEYYGKPWEDPAAQRWVAEGKHIINMVFDIREDAQLGVTRIGLEQHFYAGAWTFFLDRIENDGSDPYAMTIMVKTTPGDFNNDGVVNDADIDLLADAIEAGSADTQFDVNGDGFVDEQDLIDHIATLVERTDGGVGTYRGDFNLDGYVDGTDLAILKASFGLSGLGYAAGNANADDFVNGTDLAIFKATFGFSGTPDDGGNPPAVPEPATLSLLALGGLAVLRRRKK
ncbi:MAG: dockerin type I domain-containing protein [Planctomycetota bacterium]|jgi:hypothetical protein